jgi:predicted ThiF/HesA family dinucleotide-utilizing enzyme
MNDPLAQGSGLSVHTGRYDRWAIEVVDTAGLLGAGRLGITADQLRWLVHTGGPAALAALDQGTNPMNDTRVLAEGSGLSVHPGRYDRWAIEVVGTAGILGDGWLGISEDQLRWLVHTGGPAALAALDQPAPATEGPTP